MRLHQQVAIVTGVSHAGQLGYVLAAAFAREGALLASSARTAQRVNVCAEALRAEGASVIGIPADLTTEEGAQTLVQETLATFGQINVRVNLACGFTTYEPSDELTLAAWESELNNNMRTALLCTRAVWPIMKRQGWGQDSQFQSRRSTRSGESL